MNVENVLSIPDKEDDLIYAHRQRSHANKREKQPGNDDARFASFISCVPAIFCGRKKGCVKVVWPAIL